MKDNTPAATMKPQPFKFGYVPPKEGRIPPATVRLRRRRRATLIFVLVLVLIFCLVLKYVQTSTISKIEAELKGGWKGTEKKATGDEKQKALMAASPAAKVSKPTPVPGKETLHIPLKKDQEFDQLLQNMLSIVPDEMRQRSLLTPIKVSGAERMHEVALRTREFKKLFEAWEALHLVFQDNAVHIQDNIVPYLRSREALLKSQKAMGKEAFELAVTVKRYEHFKWLLQRLGDVLFPWIRPYFGDHVAAHTQLYGGGKGIVFTAGTEQAPFVMTSIGVLRNLGCNLPIEVMYLGDGDLDIDTRERLEDIPGVITRDIRLMIKDDGWALAGWAGKPFAILFSSFREVIFIDADALFMRNPEVLFDDAGYKSSGALFFHDRLMKADGKRQWMESVLPTPISKKARKSRMWGKSDHMQESGVIVVDTFKHFIPLLVVSRMNGPDRDGNSDKGITGVYDMLFGDKETFWLSWEMVGSEEYEFHTGPAGIIGSLPENQRNVTHDTSNVSTGGVSRVVTTYKEQVVMCAPQLLHISTDGTPLWFNGWILANKFDKHNSPIAQLETFMKEPGVYMQPESWTIGESNSCCLRNLQTFEFTPEEKKGIAMILDVAIKVGAVGKNGGVGTPPPKEG